MVHLLWYLHFCDFKNNVSHKNNVFNLFKNETVKVFYSHQYVSTTDMPERTQND